MNLGSAFAGSTTVDDLNPRVPLKVKGSVRVPLRGSFQGSIGF